MDYNKNVKTRFAPSPTGRMHVGSARTALFNYLFAQKNEGECILRIEDTDLERSKKEHEEDILDGLSWLGLSFSKTYRQSERRDIYKKHIETLIEKGLAFVSKEKEGERDEVIRFKNPGKEVSFLDAVRGEIKMNTADLGDFVLAKNMETPLYHLAVTIDDMESEITHVIRGEDGISNTPRQILIQEALGAEKPIYAHLPLILAPDRSKLSKRHGGQSLTELRDNGYLKESVINFLALLGWNPGDEREIFPLSELVNEFSLEKVQKGGAIFNIEKLNWINKHYLKESIKTDEGKNNLILKIKEVYPGGDDRVYEKLLDVTVDRINTLNDVAETDLEYFFKEPEDYDRDKLIDQKTTPTLGDVKEHLVKAKEIIEASDENSFNTNPDNIKELLWDYATEYGRGSVLWPIRFALTGKDKSPDPFYVAWVVGKDQTIKRLSHAIDLL